MKLAKLTPLEASLLVVLAQHPTQAVFRRVRGRLGRVAMRKARAIMRRPGADLSRLWSHRG